MDTFKGTLCNHQRGGRVFANDYAKRYSIKYDY